MTNLNYLGQHEAIEILQNLASRKTFYFDDLTVDEKLALNQKELIEDDYFIVLKHHVSETRKYINQLIPLNFFVNDDLELIAYCEDDGNLEHLLPSDTTLKFNRI